MGDISLSSNVMAHTFELPSKADVGNISVSSNIVTSVLQVTDMSNILADDQPEISPEQPLEISLTDEPNKLNDCTIGDIGTDHEPSEGLLESNSEDDDPEASGISNDESLKEEDHELLCQLLLTVSLEDDEHYAHQLS